jgi:carboxyl-terminal processing protease
MNRKVLLLALSILLFAGLGAREEDPWKTGLDKVAEMADYVRDYYFQPVESGKMVLESVKGLLQKLDPHSYLLEPESFARMAEEQRGKYYGIGTQIQKQEDRLVIIAPIEGGPAWRLGVLAGDIITHINGESTKTITDRDAVSKLRGPKGTKVNVTIGREGLEKPLELVITREEIPLYSVPYAFLLENGTGYIFIRHFAENTADELRTKLDDLSAQGMTSLVLDLRGNAGGPLFQSIEVADEFLPKDALVVSVKGRNRAFDREYLATSSDEYEKMPVVVLINQGSASASEIVAGAVMDHDRGLVVGEDSWGKSLVQQMFPVGPNTAVALTIARYYTPSGRSLQRDYTNFDDYILDSKPVPEKGREVKYTAKGRKVLGQGGVTPDYTVEFKIFGFTVDLRARGVFFEYARRLIAHQTPLGKKLVFPEEMKAGADPAGKIQVGRAFLANDAVLEDFKAHLAASKIPADESLFKKAEPEIRRELEREIASALFGVEEGWRAFERTDPVILKALEVMPEAARLIQR